MAKGLGAGWVMLAKSHQTVHGSWYCMTLSCIDGFAKLFLKLLHGPACRSCLMKLFLDLHEAVVQKLPCKTISGASAWSCPAKVALPSYFLSFCMKLSCRSCLPKLFPKLLSESVVQKLPFETISEASVWHCRAKVLFCEILFSISRLLRHAAE